LKIIGDTPVVALVKGNAQVRVAAQVGFDVNGAIWGKNLRMKSGRREIEANSGLRIIYSLTQVSFYFRKFRAQFRRHNRRLYEAKLGECSIRHREADQSLRERGGLSLLIRRVSQQWAQKRMSGVERAKSLRPNPEFRRPSPLRKLIY
jgi:hypothetical protein